MKKKNYIFIMIFTCLLLQGMLVDNAFAQTDLNNNQQLAAIDSAYNMGEPEKVIRLAGDYLKSHHEASESLKISLYEKMAYSQLDMGKKGDAEKSILELLRIDADFEPNPKYVPPAKVQFVEDMKAAHTANLVITTEPPDLNISINSGYRQAKSPCFFHLVEDTYLIFIESPDTAVYKNWNGSVILQGGKDKEQNIVLVTAIKPDSMMANKSKKTWYKNPFILGAGGVAIAGAAILAGAPSGGSGTPPADKKLPSHPARPNK